MGDDSASQAMAGELHEEILYLVCKHLDIRELLSIAATSKLLLEIVCSVIRQRFLSLLAVPRSSDSKDKPFLYFESSSPSDPAKLLQHPLLFETFDQAGKSTTPSRIMARFNFRHLEDAEATAPSSGRFQFQMDDTQSFQTFLLSVRLRSTSDRFRHGVYRQEVELAEGLERVWKSWFEAGGEEQTEHGRPIARNQPLDRAVSLRSLSIEKTIARANLLVYPQPTREPSPFRFVNRVNTYEMAWSSCDLNVARCMVNIEEADRRQEGSMILFFRQPVTRTRPYPLGW